MSIYSPSILITGSNGQVGKALRLHAFAKEFQLIPCSRADLNLTNLSSIQPVFAQYQPEIVIHTAAYTAVDKAEHDIESAMLINHLSVRELAILCQQKRIPLIHLSTDYIFDGKKTSAYREEDEAHPINIYGKSKWLAEEAIREHCEQHIILRVSGIVSNQGNNFFKTILRLAKGKKTLNVVSDQITCPTVASDIAYALYSIAKKLSSWGTYHYCSAPPVSWYQFAVAIIEKAKSSCELMVEEINAIPTVEYPTPAKRPLYSALNCNKIARDYGLKQPPWHSHLEGMIHEYLRTT